jgi:hypothetical protein
MHLKRLGLLLVVLLAPACYSTGTGAGGPTRDPNLISTEELLTQRAVDCYRAIEQLRPQWRRRRAGESPQVYVNGSRRGALSELRTFQTDDIREIRFINGPDATTRWGTGHRAGVIELITRG